MLQDHPTIMVVDNDEGMRVTLEGIIEDEGYNVIVAEDGYRAIELAKENPCALFSSGPHHQDSGEAKIRESTAGVSRKPSSDCKACGCSSKHLCGLTAWNT